MVNDPTTTCFGIISGFVALYVVFRAVILAIKTRRGNRLENDTEGDLQ